AAAFVILNLLGARSQKNSYARHVMGLYLYSTGATRQQISVTNHLERSRREVATSGLYVLVYDNINMVWKVAEQILGRTDSMENGTCATIVSLFQASVDDLRAIELERRLGSAPELKVSDIVLTEDEYTFHRNCLIHAVLRIAVQYGGPRLQVFRKDLQAMEPQSDFRIDVHKSEIHPLPAMNINEASTMGNAEVIDATNSQSRGLRAVLAARAGNEGGASSLRWALFIPGFFTARSPQQTVTRVVVDWIDLVHAVWHAEAVVDTFTDARMVDNLRCSRRQEDEAPKESCGGQERGTLGGDMVFENAILFLRDGLILREFSDAIKSGDSGRVLLVLKLWALSFRGSGRSKYAYEVLHLLHNVTHVWPEPVVRIVLNNWLVNPTGKANSFVELDLMQEHLNYWIKTYYQAHGSGASWEWLATISPCIEVLRRLATEVNNTLGSKQGNRHASADLTKDIKILMDSLEQNDVYKEVLGRTLGDDESPAPDAIGEGYSALTWGVKSPLRQFNRLISTLQRRRTIQPLVGTALPTQPQETSPEFPQSEDDGLAHNDPEDPDNDELELGLDEEMEQSLNDTQPVMSLQTADDIDLEMDADLQERVETLDEGDGTDNSDGDGDESDFFC
ncbi:hypothetical protein EDB84DRAFT_1549546, partial [Lactarius hengduanensis]